jgi:hypothetical protein
MTRDILSFDNLRALGLALPGVVEGTAYGAPALKLHGQLLACVPVNKSAESNSAMVRIDRSRRAELIAAHPDMFYVTEHYEPHPAMLIRLSQATRGELERSIQAAWTYVSSESAARKKPRG